MYDQDERDHGAGSVPVRHELSRPRRHGVDRKSEPDDALWARGRIDAASVRGRLGV